MCLCHSKWPCVGAMLVSAGNRLLGAIKACCTEIVCTIVSGHVFVLYLVATRLY